MQTEIRSENEWKQRIDGAIAERDPSLSNYKITLVHRDLSLALQELLGRDAGPNFHSWAVWGSRKAGVTIRQEDLDSAIKTATVVSGVVGTLTGVAASAYVLMKAPKLPREGIIFGALLGALCGSSAGRKIATTSRRDASRLVLHGNQIVLNDIGKQTARFLAKFRDGGDYDQKAIDDFVCGMRPGQTAKGGQDLLKRAFANYYSALHTEDLNRKHELVYLANCQSVLHEHIKLQPLIAAAMPHIVRRCSTQRLMTFDVGVRQLSVGHDVPALDNAVFPDSLKDLANPELIDFLYGKRGWNVQVETLDNTAAKDWTNIRERMGYIVNLFRAMHSNPDVFADPYTKEQIQAFENGEFSKRYEENIAGTRAASRFISKLQRSFVVRSATSGGDKDLRPSASAEAGMKFEEVLMSAQGGNANAQFELGRRYAEGRHVPADPEAASDWFRKAADTGHLGATFELALWAENGIGVNQNIRGAAAQYRKLAEQGYARAQMALARMCLIGKGMARDVEEAAHWYLLASEQGDATAQFNLAEMYSMGHGVEQSDQQAAKWYQKAAEHGIIEAQLRIAKMYQDGRGVPEDQKSAAKWYLRAAEAALQEKPL